MGNLRAPEELSETEKKFPNADFSLINRGAVHTGLPWGAIFDRLGWPDYFGLRLERAGKRIVIFEKDAESGKEKSQEIPTEYTEFVEQHFDLDQKHGPCCGYSNPEIAGTALFPDLTLYYMLGYEEGCMYVFWFKKNGETNLFFVLHMDGAICTNNLNNDALEFAIKKGIRLVNETAYTVCWGSVHEDETPEKWTDLDSLVKTGHI